MANEPVCLEQVDFPPGLRRLTGLSRQILRKMQESAVNAATGGGESDPEKILEWTQNNDVILEQFRQACDELERVRRIPVAP